MGNKFDRSFGKDNDRGQTIKAERQTRENSPAKVERMEGIKVKGERAPDVDDRKYGNEGNMSRAVEKLGRDTERKGYEIGGHRNDPKTH